MPAVTSLQLIKRRFHLCSFIKRIGTVNRLTLEDEVRYLRKKIIGPVNSQVTWKSPSWREKEISCGMDLNVDDLGPGKHPKSTAYEACKDHLLPSTATF